MSTEQKLRDALREIEAIVSKFGWNESDGDILIEIEGIAKQALAAEPDHICDAAKMVRLTDEEAEIAWYASRSNRAWEFTGPQREFSNAIIDAMIKKNGGV